MEEQKRDLKILCVDDEEGLRDAVTSLISEIGYTPIVANSKSNALKQLQLHSTEIIAVISDLQMPDEDGLELRSEMLRSYRDIPFIVLSGHVTRELALRALELKVAAFLEKPPNADEITAVIARESADRMTQIQESKLIAKTFYSEAWTILEELEPLILSLEEHPGDDSTINAIFRLVHTLKGASGAINSETFFKFTHRFEDILSRFKKGELQITAAAISAMLRGYDALKLMIASLESKDDKMPSLESILPLLDIKEHRSPSRGIPKLQDENQKHDHDLPLQEVRQDSIKVSTSTLNEFMELSGEITVIRNMVNKLVHSIEKSQPGNRDVTLLAEQIDEMHKINSSLQLKIMDLRKVSIGTVFRSLKRTIRDLGTSLAKEMQLVTSVESLRIDTSLSQVLSDSLIHLIRNCADHGIESAAERKGAGKDAMSTININCTEDREELIVKISDDGRGIDPEKIMKKLIEVGMYTRDEVLLMPRAELLAKIFEAGFSTATSVSAVSGRGVGMDMVRSSVNRIGGRIEISTEVGKGTAFILRLPVPRSVLIMSSILVTVDNQIFAIPQASVVRLLHLDQEQCSRLICHLEGGSLIREGDELIPLVELRSMLQHSPQSSAISEVVSKELNVVIIKGKFDTYALIIDGINDEEEIVVKRAGKHLELLKCYSGATFLGDGSVSLILDVDEIGNGLELQRRPVQVQKNTQQLSAYGLGERYLVFKLARPGLFAVPLDQVFRLEDLLHSSVKYSVGQAVIVYRDGLLPLLNLESALGFDAARFNDNHMLSVLVFRDQNRFFGFVVSTILDIISTKSQVDPGIRDRIGISGNIFLGEETACVIDFEEVLKNIGYGKTGTAMLERNFDFHKAAPEASKVLVS